MASFNETDSSDKEDPFSEKETSKRSRDRKEESSSGNSSIPEGPSKETESKGARSQDTSRESARSESSYSSSYRAKGRFSESRKRAGGAGVREWDDNSPPNPAFFEKEENYQKAYCQWCRHVERTAGIDPREWPQRMNVSDTVEMFDEALGISRSTFYRKYRPAIKYDLQPLLGKKLADREEVIIWLLIFIDAGQDAGY